MGRDKAVSEWSVMMVLMLPVVGSRSNPVLGNQAIVHRQYHQTFY